jgi:DNA-binding transcriptional MocR family regulator
MQRAPFFDVRIGGATAERRVGRDDLVAAVLADVAGGRLPPGARLPPVRALHLRLGISKNTAQAAYEELVARGVLETRPREGVFVARAEADAREPAALRCAAPAPVEVRPTRLTSRRAAPGVLELSKVFIDPTLLPRERLADCLRSVLHQPGLHELYDFQGYPPLREAIAKRLQGRGMDVRPDDVLTTVGSQQAIDLVGRCLQGRRIAVENPTYQNARPLFESQGHSVVGLSLDPFEGVPLAHWEEVIVRERPSLMYLVTSFQNPSGYSYATDELLAMLELSARHGVALLEDDWGSDMLSGTEYRPTLRALGGREVLYANSFTKKLLPSLRMGFLVGNERTMPALLEAKRLSILGHSTLQEAALFEFLDRGYYDAHLARLHEELDRRYHACLEALHEHMPAGVRWTTPGGGPTLWLELPRVVPLRELEARMAARRIQVELPGLHFLGRPHLHGFAIGYAYNPPERLGQGLAALGEELRTWL